MTSSSCLLSYSRIDEIFLVAQLIRMCAYRRSTGTGGQRVCAAMQIGKRARSRQTLEKVEVSAQLVSTRTL
jgi:hypothetical protein